jgi:hypothetical protein
MFLGKIGNINREDDVLVRFKKDRKKSGKNNKSQNFTEFLNKYLEERGQLDLSLPEESEDKYTFTISSTTSLAIRRFLRFFFYYLIGILVYQSLEGWSFTDTVWFITQTFTTVGYGNITPTSEAARTFTMFFIIAGMVLAFAAINDSARLFVFWFRSKYNVKKLKLKKIKKNKFQLIVRSVFNILMWAAILFFVALFGATVFALNEDWAFYDAMYFTIYTMTSVGYGDIVPKKSSSIWFNNFFLLLTIPLTIVALEKITSFRRHYQRADLWEILEEIELSKPLLEAINKKEMRVSKAEYILHMLQLEGKLDYVRDLLRWDEKFKEFDLTKDGYLTMQDVEEFQANLLRDRIQSISVASTSAHGLPGIGMSGQLSRRNTNNGTAGGGGGAFSRTPSIIHQFMDETKDVFFETFGLHSRLLDESHDAEGSGGLNLTPLHSADRNDPEAASYRPPKRDGITSSSGSGHQSSHSHHHSSYRSGHHPPPPPVPEEEEEENPVHDYTVSPLAKAKALRDASIMSTTKSIRDRSVQDLVALVDNEEDDDLRGPGQSRDEAEEPADRHVSGVSFGGEEDRGGPSASDRSDRI